MGGACSTYGGKSYTGLWWGNLRVREHLEDPGIDGRIILRPIFRKNEIGGARSTCGGEESHIQGYGGGT
jgi:hypothetical protein